MTRSIFDPDGGETERSGERYMGPDADQISHMPPDIVDGRVDGQENEQSADEEPEKEQTEMGRQNDLVEDADQRQPPA